MSAPSSTAFASLPVNPEACFSDAEGTYRRRLETRCTRLLRRAAPILGRILESGEEIASVIPACSPYSLLELLTTGWLIGVVRRCLLVVTDRRMLHLPTRGSFQPRGSVSEIRFADLESAGVSGALHPRLRLRYRNGERETFTGLPGPAAKKLALLLDLRIGQGAPSEEGGRHFLCPYCAQALAREVTRCDVCGLAFRERRKAMRYSLLIPGGGYFYTGHGLLGLVDALVESFLLLAVVSGVALGVSGAPEVWPGTLMLAAVLAVEKLITLYHAQHYVCELLPVDPKAALSEQAAAAR